MEQGSRVPDGVESSRERIVEASLDRAVDLMTLGQEGNLTPSVEQ
jgi:hypothetical protein